MSDTLLEFDRVRFAYHLDPVLQDFNWRWQRGENWAIVGGNGSGKTTIARLICDDCRPQRGSIRRGVAPERTAHISFDLQRQMMEHDRRFDDSELREDAFDVGTTVKRAILGRAEADGHFQTLCERLHISHILERGIRYISTGESRKTLIARALFRRPELLILDNPVEGLDARSREEMRRLIDELLSAPIPVLLLLKDRADLPARLTRVLDLSAPGAAQARTWTLPGAPECRQEPPPVLFELHGVNVDFRGTPVLRDIHWTLKRGQHAVIRGPNGAGKSTLLGLLCGENDKAYGQNIALFGRARGTGESIWDIKARFGLVSTALQLNHLRRQRVAEVVASGLFDSIGLYRDPGDAEKRQVRDWLQAFELWPLRQARFTELSFGQQRLVLLARAMVKWPTILILDEPCIGLDAVQRAHILSAVDAIAEAGHSHVLYVSHNPEEMPGCINQQLDLVPAAGGGYTASVKDVLEPVPDIG